MDTFWNSWFRTKNKNNFKICESQKKKRLKILMYNSLSELHLKNSIKLIKNINLLPPEWRFFFFVTCISRNKSIFLFGLTFVKGINNSCVDYKPIIWTFLYILVLLKQASYGVGRYLGKNIHWISYLTLVIQGCVLFSEI